MRYLIAGMVLLAGSSFACDDFAFEKPRPVEERTVQDLRDDGFVVVVWRPEFLYGFHPNDFWAILEQQGWNIVVQYAPDWPFDVDDDATKSKDRP